MDTHLQIHRQEWIEETFSRKNIDAKVKQAILSNPVMVAKIAEGVHLVNEYIEGQYYASKMARVRQLKGLNIEAMITSIFVGIAYFQMETLFTSVCAQIAGRLGFSDKRDAILTMSEILAVLCNTDVFDLIKEDREASLMLVSRIPLEKNLVAYIENSTYLPPMVCKPLPLENNYSSGYLSYKDSLVLGKGNHHDGDLCLDALNIMNGVALRIDEQFLTKCEEVPNHEFSSAEERDQWSRFKWQSYCFYEMLVKMGNRMYLTHKPDKRGRIYAQGYHITTQGSAFKKAMLELANEEVVDGVPT